VGGEGRGGTWTRRTGRKDWKVPSRSPEGLPISVLPGCVRDPGGGGGGGGGGVKTALIEAELRRTNHLMA